MKKELQKAAKIWALASGLAILAPSVQAQLSSTEGAHPASAQERAGTAQGRVVLSVEDLKTLLGINTRDPSSAFTTHARLNHEDSDGMYSLNIHMSAAEKQHLTRQISQIEKAKLALVAKTEKKKALKNWNCVNRAKTFRALAWEPKPAAAIKICSKV